MAREKAMLDCTLIRKNFGMAAIKDTTGRQIAYEKYETVLKFLVNNGLTVVNGHIRKA